MPSKLLATVVAKCLGSKVQVLGSDGKLVISMSTLQQHRICIPTGKPLNQKSHVSCENSVGAILFAKSINHDCFSPPTRVATKNSGNLFHKGEKHSMNLDVVHL